jgi:hypothetical protein
LCFCYLEAPSREAIEGDHEKLNLKCDWITEVESIGETITGMAEVSVFSNPY